MGAAKIHVRMLAPLMSKQYETVNCGPTGLRRCVETSGLGPERAPSRGRLSSQAPASPSAPRRPSRRAAARGAAPPASSGPQRHLAAGASLADVSRGTIRWRPRPQGTSPASKGRPQRYSGYRIERPGLSLGRRLSGRRTLSAGVTGLRPRRHHRLWRLTDFSTKAVKAA